MVAFLLLVSCTQTVTEDKEVTPEKEVTSPPQAQGETLIVNSTADAGPGTLRQALLEAQSGDTITFDPAVFPPAAPVAIYLTSSLPPLSQGNLTIDGSNAGVILDGINILNTSGYWITGLEINSDGNIIQGLQIVNFSPGVGIALGDGAQYNAIGGDRSVGSGPLGQVNLVSEVSTGIGIFDDGTSFNTVTGNLIGTDPTGIDAWSNYSIGVHILNGASRNIIGPDNIIAYNNIYGIEIQDSNSFGNTITQNSIHDNKEGGIYLWDGGNTELRAPVILDFDLARGTVTGFAGANCTVEIFSDSSNEGKVYEGQATSDSSGFFAFGKGASFAGPCLTTTATDADGNTSEFSVPTSGIKTSTILQERNNVPKSQLETKQSRELEDNRIGLHFCNLWHLEPEIFPNGVLDASHILQLGVKRARFSINDLDSPKADWSKPEFSIDPSHDDFITSLADNGITITYVLSFWDKESVSKGEELPSPRFKTEEEIQRYLAFVQLIVHHFKNRIEYYEIWNEPTITDTIQWIEVEDYINLVERTVAVIRREYPEAKIVVGSTSYLIFPEDQEYLFTILRSDIMPLVDVVSWHPMYGTSPEYDFHRQYYYEYPSIVQEIKDVASAHGFTGEYEADELNWLTPDQADSTIIQMDWPIAYSETKCAKYLARGIVMHLGMDVTVSQCLLTNKPQLFHTRQNLCTIMAGAEPVSLPVEIESAAENIKSFNFSLPNGDKLVALWIDSVAVDDDPGINSTITFPRNACQRVVAIDILNSFQQELITSVEADHFVIEDVLVKDYPIILRLIP